MRHEGNSRGHAHNPVPDGPLPHSRPPPPHVSRRGPKPSQPSRACPITSPPCLGCAATTGPSAVILPIAELQMSSAAEVREDVSDRPPE